MGAVFENAPQTCVARLPLLRMLRTKPLWHRGLLLAGHFFCNASSRKGRPCLEQVTSPARWHATSVRFCHTPTKQPHRKDTDTNTPITTRTPARECNIIVSMYSLKGPFKARFILRPLGPAPEESNICRDFHPVKLLTGVTAPTLAAGASVEFRLRTSAMHVSSPPLLTKHPPKHFLPVFWQYSGNMGILLRGKEVKIRQGKIPRPVRF